MKWRSGRRSANMEDRRGQRVSRGAKGGGLGLIVIALVALYLGVDPSIILQQATDPGPQVEQGPYQPTAAEAQLADFVSVVLADTEDTWHQLFSEAGRQYREPKLVLFTGGVRSACGLAQSAMGPFYCPADQKVYIDLSFYRDLRERYGAPGDFAQAYVIAHEVAHHVQTLLGISEKVHAERSRVGEVAANQLSVRQELQADCLAGVWAYHADRTRQVLEQGDIEEALTAASAIGDDRLQRQTQGRVVPDSFTHGTSEQRVQWFRKGFSSGDSDRCDTFNAATL